MSYLRYFQITFLWSLLLLLVADANAQSCTPGVGGLAGLSFFKVEKVELVSEQGDQADSHVQLHITGRGTANFFTRADNHTYQSPDEDQPIELWIASEVAPLNYKEPLQRKQSNAKLSQWLSSCMHYANVVREQPTKYLHLSADDYTIERFELKDGRLVLWLSRGCADYGADGVICFLYKK